MTLPKEAPSATVFSIGYDFHITSGDNGNVFQLVNYKDNTRSQVFTYDQLNRLTSGNTSASNAWGTNYTLDTWGNLSQKTPMPGMLSGENFSQTVLSNNRLAGFGYDAAGNTTTPDPAGVRKDPALNPSNPNSSTTSSPADQTQAPMESRAQGKGERGQTSKPDNPTKGAKPIRDKDGKITGWRLPTPDGKGVKKGLDWGRANGLDPAKFQTAARVGVIGAIGAGIGYAIATAPEWAPYVAAAAAAF